MGQLSVAAVRADPRCPHCGGPLGLAFDAGSLRVTCSLGECRWWGWVHLIGRRIRPADPPSPGPPPSPWPGRFRPTAAGEAMATIEAAWREGEHIVVLARDPHDATAILFLDQVRLDPEGGPPP